VLETLANDVKVDGQRVVVAIVPCWMFAENNTTQRSDVYNNKRERSRVCLARKSSAVSQESLGLRRGSVANVSTWV
jgi:hypothetical protein